MSIGSLLMYYPSAVCYIKFLPISPLVNIFFLRSIGQYYEGENSHFPHTLYFYLYFASLSTEEWTSKFVSIYFRFISLVQI